MKVIIFKTRQADGKWKIAGYYGKKEYALRRQIYEAGAIYQIKNFPARNKKYVAYAD